MEYLVTMTTHVPEGTSEQAVADMRAQEAAHTRELAAQGHVLRLWRAAPEARRVRRTDEVTPLTPHPSDPGLAATALSGVTVVDGGRLALYRG